MKPRVMSLVFAGCGSTFFPPEGTYTFPNGVAC